MFESEHLNIRKLQIMKGEEELHTCTHYHFKSWEDFETPNESSFQILKELLELTADHVIQSYTNMINSQEEPERVLLHCMAGLGRTGTFISLLQAVISIKVQKTQIEGEGTEATAENIKVCPFSIVRKLREQRYGSVQTDDQYVFVHQFLKQFTK